MLNQEQIDRLGKEILEWSTKNFITSEKDTDNPLFGIAEEIGELCHAHLKGKQGIRHTPQEIEILKKDAIADTMIYLLDYCSRNNIFLNEKSSTFSPVRYNTLDKALKGLVASCGNLLFNTMFDSYTSRILVPTSCQHVMLFLNLYSEQSGWNFSNIVEEIWKVVKQRNWQRSR